MKNDRFNVNSAESHSMLAKHSRISLKRGGYRHHSAKEGAQNFFVWFSGILTVVILLVIIIYILWHGLPQLSWRFFTTPYSPSSDTDQGILPMIINTLYLVIVTLVLCVPVSLATSVYLTHYAKPGKMLTAIRYTTEVLSGIPSIIFGLVGAAFFSDTLGLGYSVLSGALTMTIMVLPTIVRTSEEALLAVPASYREGALALGASRLRVIRTISLPSALPGILTAVILAMGRVVGESAALIFTLGMAYKMPTGIFDHLFASARTLTLHLYQLFSQGLSMDQAFGTATVLLLLVLLLNFVANRMTKAFQKGDK